MNYQRVVRATPWQSASLQIIELSLLSVPGKWKHNASGLHIFLSSQCIENP